MNMGLLKEDQIKSFLEVINYRSANSKAAKVNNVAYPLVEALISQFVSKDALDSAAQEYAETEELVSTSGLLLCNDLTFYEQNKDAILAFADSIKSFGKTDSMLIFIYNDMNVLDYNLVSLDTLAQAVYMPQTKPHSDLDINNPIDQSFMGLANWALLSCMWLTLKAYSQFQEQTRLSKAK